MVIIREARPSDRRQVAEFTAHTWRWGDYIMSAWENWISDKRGKLLVAEEDNRVIGIMHLALRPGGEAYLAGARVHPMFRRKGVATALTKKCIEYARSMGAKFVSLATSSRNIAAISLAEKLGFSLAQELTQIGSWPKKSAEPKGIRKMEVEEAEKVLKWVNKRINCRPVKFKFFEWSTLRLDDLKKYSDEGFAAVVGRTSGVVLYQPYSTRHLFIMIDFFIGEEKASEELGLFLRKEASVLGCKEVWGYVKLDKEAISGLKKAGFRVRKEGMRIYEMKL